MPFWKVHTAVLSKIRNPAAEIKTFISASSFCLGLVNPAASPRINIAITEIIIGIFRICETVGRLISIITPAIKKRNRTVSP